MAIQSIERAAAILRALAGGSRRLGVSELSDHLGLAKGTVHGLLQTLKDEGFVEQDPESGKYQLGAALLQLGNIYLDVNELRGRSLAWADSLAVRTGEAVRVGSLHGDGVLIIHHVFRPDNSLQILEVGGTAPPPRDGPREGAAGVPAGAHRRAPGTRSAAADAGHAHHRLPTPQGARGGPRHGLGRGAGRGRDRRVVDRRADLRPAW